MGQNLLKKKGITGAKGPDSAFGSDGCKGKPVRSGDDELSCTADYQGPLSEHRKRALHITHDE